LKEPLDTSARAQQRSPSWQKCLILGLDAVKNYDQVVWIDSDILINHRTASDISLGVPCDKVGAVEEIGFSQAESVAASRFLERAFDYWPDAVINRTAAEFYTKYGLPGDCDRVLNAGMMVLSPKHHRALLEHVYYSYEEKGGREWLMEMRPLSYEIIKSGAIHWIDPRFNLLWQQLEMIYYPFLLPKPASGKKRPLLSRLKRKMLRLSKAKSLKRARHLCLNAAFQCSFFLHFGGMRTDEMKMVNDFAKSWLDLL
jgi:hypothetical protein